MTTLRERCAEALTIERYEDLTARSRRATLIYQPKALASSDRFVLSDTLRETVGAARWQLKKTLRVGYIDRIEMNRATFERLMTAVENSHGGIPFTLEGAGGRYGQHYVMVDNEMADNAVKFIASQREPIS